MPDLEPFFPAAGAFSVPSAEKQPRLLAELNRLTAWHATRCPGYARILEALGETAAPAATLAQVPFLPAQLFKRTLLTSAPADAIVRTLRSSGTTGQAPSRIALDRDTADLQARALGHLMREFLGPRRRPMVIIDEPVRLSDGGFTARGAGQLGFAPLGRDHFHLIKPDGTPDVEGLRAWLGRQTTESVVFVGMTAPAWTHLLDGPGRAAGLRCARPALLIHGGGWKKLAARQVTPAAFKAAARELGIAETRDYYGMVEQTGSIHVEDDDGFLLTPLAGDVLVRHPRTLAPVPDGETGLLQVFSVLPRSYPGHSILTEDLGRITGRDNSPAGRRGTRFEVLGRLPVSELRGCSDAAPAP
jgi:phenylacetate-coenzyme A ligase PaaK-like adenylate-forming protein